MASRRLQALATEHSAMGDRLRKSFSYEPLAMQRQESSTSSSSDERPARSLEATRLHSASLNQIKSGSNIDNEFEFASDDQATDPSAINMDALAEDDVFTDIPHHRGFLEDSSSSVPPRATGGPGPIDAQGIYPPSACVFVANLTQMESDEALEAEVTRLFSEFGTVFVKIRRDGKNMPFAFCQFTSDQDARDAVAHSSGRIILGRPCRVEKAKANSTFIVYKNSRMPTDEDEAYILMDTLGEIASITPLSPDVQHEMDLPEAMVVQFKMYDPRRDTRQASRRDQRFVIREYEPVVSSPQTRRETKIRAEEMAEYDRDRRSAYFGNLPIDLTEEELIEMAVACGQIRNRRLYHKTYKGGSSTAVCFAFIEFARPDSVDDVITTYNGIVIRGHVIKVERKLSRCFSDQERDNRLSNKQSNHSQMSKPWRAPDLGYSGSSRMTYTPQTIRNGRMTASPVRNPSSPALSSPTASTYERANTIAARRTQDLFLESPTTPRVLAHGIATRATYSPSVFGSVRASASGRRHVRDIFDLEGEYGEPDPNAFHHQIASIDAHRALLSSPGKTNTLGSGLVKKGSAIALSNQVHSWVSSQNLRQKDNAAEKLTRDDYSPSEDETDNESGGAPFSPESEHSTLADVSSLPDVSRMSISDTPAMPGMDMDQTPRATSYYGLPSMPPYQMQPMIHPMGHMTPVPPPMATYAHHPTSSMTGSHMMMPYLPTPYSDFYGPVMFSPPRHIHVAGGQDSAPVTPTRFGPSGARRRGKGEQEKTDAESTVVEPSPSRAADRSRLHAQLHARRESQETLNEPEVLQQQDKEKK